ncbi:MAG: hypothetical protein R3250_08345, partial [Melioribacteraceae bacterium]|nr:hypothetical protein [Melioribacteraceae bacterium]
MSKKENDDRLSTLIKMFTIIGDQMKDLKEKQDDIKTQVAEFLHEVGEADLIVDVDGVKWRVFYQGRDTKKVDYNQLYNILGQHQYNEVVKVSHSEFLAIRKAPKSEQHDLTQKSPQNGKKTLSVPDG